LVPKGKGAFFRRTQYIFALQRAAFFREAKDDNRPKIEHSCLASLLLPLAERHGQSMPQSATFAPLLAPLHRWQTELTPKKAAFQASLWANCVQLEKGAMPRF
jgi:hypothetical protein